MIIFQVVQVVLSVMVFSKTALIFWYRQFLLISGRLDAWTTGSFSLVVSSYKKLMKKMKNKKN